MTPALSQDQQRRGVFAFEVRAIVKEKGKEACRLTKSPSPDHGQEVIERILAVAPKYGHRILPPPGR